MFSQCMQHHLLLHLAKCLLQVVLLVEILACLTVRVMLCRILDSSTEAVVARGMKGEAHRPVVFDVLMCYVVAACTRSRSLASIFCDANFAVGASMSHRAGLLVAILGATPTPVSVSTRVRAALDGFLVMVLLCFSAFHFVTVIEL